LFRELPECTPGVEEEWWLLTAAQLLPAWASGQKRLTVVANGEKALGESGSEIDFEPNKKPTSLGFGTKRNLLCIRGTLRHKSPQPSW